MSFLFVLFHSAFSHSIHATAAYIDIIISIDKWQRIIPSLGQSIFVQHTPRLCVVCDSLSDSSRVYTALNYRMVNSNERFNFIQPIVLIVYAICREECSENVGTPTHGLTCRMSRKLHRYLRYAVALCVHQSNARSSSMCIVRPDVRLWTFHLGLLLHSLLMARICCRNSNVTCFANFGLHFVCGRTWKVTISTLH